MKDDIKELVRRYPILESSRQSIYDAYNVMEEGFVRGGKLLIAGNGGSAADAEHMVGELMKGFALPRRINNALRKKLKDTDCIMGEELSQKLQGTLPAIALDNHSSLNTAFANDVDGSMCYAQQVMGYGVEGDMLLAISTSGNSRNILYAAVTAKAKGLHVVGLTGAGGGRLAAFADVLIAVNEKEAYKVQELHLPVYHCLCLMLEKRFFEGKSTKEKYCHTARNERGNPD